MPTPFSQLYYALGDTQRAEAKVDLIATYLATATGDEFGWAVHLLIGGTCKAGIRTSQLREWAAEMAQIPLWLLEESYGVVGDLAETLALLVGGTKDGAQATKAPSSLTQWVKIIQSLAGLTHEERKDVIAGVWHNLSVEELLVFNKLLTGGLRIGVSKGLLARALAKVCDSELGVIWQRLTGQWKPEDLSREFFTDTTRASESIHPYPFFLAYPLDRDVKELGEIEDWQVEWKWDGIRAQLVKRVGLEAVWSRGDELISDSFPDLVDAASLLPDGTVLDGEIVAWKDSKPGSFFDLQKRINRRKITKSMMTAVPVRFLAYDLLEYSGSDMRARPLKERLIALRSCCDVMDTETDIISFPNHVKADSWEEVMGLRLKAREFSAEGLMLKRLESLYGVGRTDRGAWWKWKVDPFTIDAVLLYAQKGHGRRANLFTDYTFAVWDGDLLVTFAKAYSGLTDKELVEIDAFIKRNTKERFGPVRTVEPELVFELTFEAVQRSSRHRSGVAVRFPRISRWRRDKKASEADTIETLRALIER